MKEKKPITKTQYMENAVETLESQKENWILLWIHPIAVQWFKEK